MQEKIKQLYKKYKVKVEENYIDNIIQDKSRLKEISRLYKSEEIKSMQEVLGKQANDYYFTQQELEFVSKMDLFDPYMIKIAKEIWKNRNNSNKLIRFLRILQG